LFNTLKIFKKELTKEKEMNLSRLKFKHLSNEELIDEAISSAWVDGSTDEVCSSSETQGMKNEIKARLLDKDIEILRLRREADKDNGLRMGEIRCN
jgi:hypothetical protein